jgi:hypothetical protein
VDYQTGCKTPLHTRAVYNIRPFAIKVKQYRRFGKENALAWIRKRDAGHPSTPGLYTIYSYPAQKSNTTGDSEKENALAWAVTRDAGHPSTPGLYTIYSYPAQKASIPGAFYRKSSANYCELLQTGSGLPGQRRTPAGPYSLRLGFTCVPVKTRFVLFNDTQRALVALKAVGSSCAVKTHIQYSQPVRFAANFGEPFLVFFREPSPQRSAIHTYPPRFIYTITADFPVLVL